HDAFQYIYGINCSIYRTKPQRSAKVTKSFCSKIEDTKIIQTKAIAKALIYGWLARSPIL
ncbi:MAG: hypothetical protein ACK53P_19585, partial [Pseudanabaena sp.]